MATDLQQLHIAAIRGRAAELASALKAAHEAGVPPGIVIPQLVLVFREVFGGDASPEAMGRLAEIMAAGDG